MCTVCGCGEAETRVEDLPANQKAVGSPAESKGMHGHAHAHPHDHEHAHDHEIRDDPTERGRLIRVEEDILGKNNAIAAKNRGHFAAHGVLALNLVSSPGAGKTALLVSSLKELIPEKTVAVIEGDQETTADADRIRNTGAPAVQVNTGKGCHLDAQMIDQAFHRLHINNGILFIENVGNLVCPAGFDLGEAHKLVIASVTEGEDKPLKYPNMFAAASLMLVSKVDLLPHLDFDVDALISNARKVNPSLSVIKVSAKTGEGLDRWLAWIDAARAMAASAD
jgi:hydrogenase nickel incorporation protein HypB